MSDNKSTGVLTGREIAVIGMAGRFPGARNLKQFWQNLRDGVESVKFFSDEELLAAGEDPQILRDPHYVKAGSVLDEVEMFDASFFGYNAREAEIMDPQQRLFLEHSWHALEDAGYTSSQCEGLIGVYAGVAWNTYLLSNLSTRLDLFEGAGGFQIFITNDKDFMPTRLSYKLNLRGPSVIIQTSCSTSLVAVHLACLSLLNYECDLALAGGATIKVPQVSGYFHQEGGLASPDGHCRAFDARAAGTIFGSGIGVVVLKRLSEALEDGDTIRAVIKGTAINNDGSAKVSYTAPSVEGQAEVIAAAQAIAGVSPETIQYIETHGTGTSLGDPVEITAINKVFSRSTQKKNFCGIGSVKTNVGHLDAAAGVAGLIKTVLSLENKELPPSLNFERPNPAIQFENTPFYVNSSLTAWKRNGEARRAGVSSFGVGGTNAHAILEEAPQRDPSGPSRPLQLLTISARTASALERVTSDLATHLAENQNTSLPDLAYTLKAGRNVFRHRRILVCSDRADALQALESTNSKLLTAVDTEDPRERPVIFMFSGQGSQYVNMGRDLFENEAVFRENLHLCAKLLKPHLGFDLLQVLFPRAGEEEKASEHLERTETTQPALFALEYSLALLWMHWGITPRAMIGHSIGEYVAATLAGVMSLEEALALVAARGKLMQQQPAGKMLAVQLPEEEILPLLTPGIALAAVNGPSSSVVSGPAEEIEGLQQELTKREVEFRALHTSHAFHSGMMDSMLEPFAREVKKIKLQPPVIPFISNLSGTWITPEQATDPKYWALHLRNTVRFSQGMHELLQDSERIFLEVGPGRTLATVATHHPKRTGQVVLSSLRHPKEEGRDFARLLESLGRLWMAGLKIDWRKFYQGERRYRVPLPLYPFERQRYWIDPLPRTAQKETGKSRATVGKKPDISDWFYLPSWKPTLFPAPADEQHGSWLVLADGCGFGERLAAELAGDGRRVVMVKTGEEFCRKDETTFVLRVDNKEDYVRLLEELRNQDQLPGAIVHAWSLSADGAPVRKFSEFEEYQSCASYSLLFLVQALSKYSDSKFDLSVVSNHVQRPVAGERLHPEKAPMLGLCRVASQEISNIRCRLIDVA
ncbi:MAG TPA: type I polyketide synthase, partial [Candidatus Solibacter sp.]|nr:type I polyketide synthase [Candidatus Solibacter sp.]